MIPRCHELKARPDFFDSILLGTKRFEIRYNDRGFRVGDHLLLREYGAHYSGRLLLVDVIYITDFEQKPGFVVMSIQVMAKGDG